MLNHYGPTLLLGVLIGGAILLDDVITPERKGHPPRVAMFHHGEAGGELKALAPQAGHNVWVVKGDDDAQTEIHKEMRIELSSEDADSADETQQLMISVSIDAEDEPTGDLAAAIGAVIDAAKAEGREPTREEIEAAVTAIAGDARSIDVEVLSSKD
ncbi:MAG: hypothetical protein EBY45_06580 [Gammaproteobacteria bacterium]|nr:hypothetical protein [Gammaproteobacteria bacterium]